MFRKTPAAVTGNVDPSSEAGGREISGEARREEEGLD